MSDLERKHEHERAQLFRKHQQERIDARQVERDQWAEQYMKAYEGQGE